MAALRSNWQAIMFYSCDLFIYYYYYLFIIIYFFRTLIFEAEERRPVGP